MRFAVESIGLVGPGLQGWEASRDVLAGRAPYRPGPTSVPPGFPATPERRRMGESVKLALATGWQAFETSACEAASTPTVFTTSCGDGETLHRLCESLAAPEREVSPTRFHNSVHNAAAGYWGIATGSMEATTSLCAYDASFAAGLLEAATQVLATGSTAALIAYDQPYPEPLHAVRPIVASFGVALILTPQARAGSCALVDLQWPAEIAPPTRMEDSELEKLRLGVPAARSLPLLAGLARGTACTVFLERLAGFGMKIEVRPCS